MNPPPGVRRQRNPRGSGVRLRGDIVAATRRIIEDDPAATLSLRSIARETGVTPPSIYTHFASVEEILEALVEEMFAELTNSIETALAGATTAAERLRTACRAYLKFGMEQPNRYVLLFGSTVLHSRPTPIEIETMPGAAAFSLLLEAVRACDPARNDALDVAVALWCGSHGYLTLTAREPGFPWPDADSFLNTLLATVART